MMKNIFSKLLIIGVISISIVNIGCKKDDSVSSNFTFNGKNYNLDYCALDFKGLIVHIPYTTYKYELLLATSGISYDQSTAKYTGNGSMIRLSLYSGSPLEMQTGLYTHDAFSSKDSLTVNLDSIFINHDFSTGISEFKRSIKNGVIDISRSGNVFNFKFEFYAIESLFIDDNKINGFYNGTLDEHDAIVAK